jgi:hypothetical protein
MWFMCTRKGIKETIYHCVSENDPTKKKIEELLNF